MGLVITRKTEESFMIGDDLEVKIVRIEGDRVRIKIDGAKKQFPVYRREVWEKMQLEKLAEVFKEV